MGGKMGDDWEPWGAGDGGERGGGRHARKTIDNASAGLSAVVCPVAPAHSKRECTYRRH